MEEEREPETVELIRNIGVEEGQQAAHIIQTVDLHKSSVWVQKYTNTPTDTRTHITHTHTHYLRAECGFLVEVTMHERAILSGRDFTSAGGTSKMHFKLSPGDLAMKWTLQRASD